MKEILKKTLHQKNDADGLTKIDIDQRKNPTRPLTTSGKEVPQSNTS